MTKNIQIKASNRNPMEEEMDTVQLQNIHHHHHHQGDL